MNTIPKRKGVLQMELTKAIKDIDMINEILDVYPKYSKNYMLIYYLLHTGLRISDALTARVGDRNGMRILKEQKTGKRKALPINDNLAEKISMYAMQNGLTDDDYIFFSDRQPSDHIKRNRAYQILRHAGEMLGVQLSAHTLRKTYGYLQYNTYEKTNGRQGASLPELMSLFNHSTPEITLRYNGIEQENLDDIVLNTGNMFASLGITV